MREVFEGNRIKGFNVIEAYCKISKLPISQADINLNLAVQVEGEWIFRCYSEEMRIYEKSEDLKRAVLAINRGEVTVDSIEPIAVQYKVEAETLVNYLACLISQSRVWELEKEKK